MIEQTRREFDRIAIVSEQQKEVSGNYDRFLLALAPRGSKSVLEIGCGMGGLSRALAARASRVTAIDLSDEMIRIARQRSDHYSNIEYVVGDVLQMDLAADSYDCIVMIATLHHLPADVVLEQLIRSLAPRGVLIVHDLLASSGFFDKSLNLIRLPAAALLRWFRGGRLLRTREVRRAWAEHGKRERYLTIEEVEALRDRCLPGASVKRHLLWRYTVVWSENALSGR